MTNEELINDRIPDWAVGRTDGTLVLGAQLPTKDGRRIGNAHIVDITSKIGPEFETAYEVLTDAGTRFVMTMDEVFDAFYPPQWVSDPVEVRRKFQRDEQP